MLLCVSQKGQTRWWEQEIPIGGSIQKGQLLTYNLSELNKPDSYLVRLTPITRYGEGDASERIITYSGALFSSPSTSRHIISVLFRGSEGFPHCSVIESTPPPI